MGEKLNRSLQYLWGVVVVSQDTEKNGQTQIRLWCAGLGVAVLSAVGEGGVTDNTKCLG